MTSLPAAVLWDMDGTLVDTEPYWIASERSLVARYGGEWPDHHAHHLVGFDLLDAGAYIAEHGPVPLTPAEIVDDLLDGVTTRVHDEIPWRPGARELLADLVAHGVPCALVTMSWRRVAAAVVDALPPGSFTAVVCGDDVTNGHTKAVCGGEVRLGMWFAVGDIVTTDHRGERTGWQRINHCSGHPAPRHRHQCTRHTMSY